MSIATFQGPFRDAFLLTLGFALVFTALLPPGIYSVDGNAMLAASESLVTHRGFTVPEGTGVPGVGGRFYSHWYPLLSILAVPFAYAGLLASRMTGLPFHYLAAVFSLLLTGALTAATCGMVALLTLRMGGSRKGAWLAAVSYGIGTVALAYGRTFYADPLLAFCIVSALYFTLCRSPRDVLLGACFCGLAMLAKPTGLVTGPLLASYLVLKRIPFPRCILPAAGTCMGFVIYAGYNILRFGHPLNFGIESPFRIANFLPGVAGLLASPGYGLLWYCPPVILAIFGFRKAIKDHMFEALAIVAVFAAFLFLHSPAWYWYAGWSWGPRYLLPGIPGLCALTGLLEGNLRKGLIALTLLGFLVNAPTLFSFYERYSAELIERGIPTNESIAWSFRYAPFLHEWPAALRQVGDARRSDVREIFAQRGAPSRTIEASRALRVVAVWWWVLPVARIPRWIGAAISTFLVGLGMFCMRRAFQAEPQTVERLE